MNRIDAQAAATLLGQQDDILILSHQKPDGDTLGSAFALLYALQHLGKRARVECSDGYPDHYAFLCGGYQPVEFEPRFVVTVDVAGPKLLGKLQPVWESKIDLCIDHHQSNTIQAAHHLLDPESAAAAQIVHRVITALGAPVDSRMADCLYTGVSTDTGCFKYANTDAETHRLAADMIDAGANYIMINKAMFETMSRGRLEIEKQVMESLEYHFDGRCAIITVPHGMTEKYGVTEEELDGISSLPRKIKGVLAGVTLRERPNGIYRVSLRTDGGVDAAAICMQFGGGGHKNAAGCTLSGGGDAVREKLLAAVGATLDALGA